MNGKSLGVVASGIEFGSTRIREVGDQASDQWIAISTIRSCRLCYGSIVNHPKLQIVFGSVLVLAFAFSAGSLLSVLSKGRRIGLKFEAALVVFAGVGVWMICDALRKQHHIKVFTMSGVSKLRLIGVIDDSTISELRTAAAEGSKIVL